MDSPDAVGPSHPHQREMSAYWTWLAGCVSIAIATAVAVLLPSGSPAFATQIVPMSFEQAAQAADIVVLGTVTDNPELGTEESGIVVHTSRFRVDQYLKGSGNPEIDVQTIGGSFMMNKDGHPERMTQIAGGQPQLPPTGSRVLLFLTRYGSGGAYMICSASHGVLPIVRRTGATEDTVSLAFQRPDVMTARAAADFNRAKTAGPIGPDEFFHDDVPVSQLRDLIARATASAPKPVPATPRTN